MTSSWNLGGIAAKIHPMASSVSHDACHKDPSSETSGRILYMLSSSVGVAMIGLGIVWPLVPVYARELGATGFQLGAIISSFSLARTFFNPLIGRLSDRRGRRPIISIGLLAYAAVSVLYVHATGVGTLFLVRFLHGFSSVLVVPIAMALAADIAPKDRVGLYMGTLNMAVMLGLGVGPMLGGWIWASLGMQAAFLSMGGLTFLTFFGVRAFIPPDREMAALRRDRTLVPFRTLLKDRVIRGLFLQRLVAASGQGCVYSFLPLLGLGMNVSGSQVGVILGANILVIAFLQRSFGALADRVNPLHQIVLGMFLSGMAILVMPLAGGYEGLLALNVVMGLGTGIASPAGLALGARIGRSVGMASVMGLSEAGFSMGMIASPIFSGLIMDALGLPSIFLTGGGLILLGTWPVFLYLRGYEER